MLILLNFSNRTHVVHASQAQRQTRRAGATGSTHAVYMDLRIRRDIHVDHSFELVDIKPP